jgi:hypothetical protein
VAGEHAFYFDDDTPEGLANSIKSWLELLNQGAAPSSRGIKCLTWKESAEQLRDVISVVKLTGCGRLKLAPNNRDISCIGIVRSCL